MKSRELTQLEAAIDDAIRFGEKLADGAPERAMIARHVCVLASGFLENIVRTRLSEFARQSRPKAEIESYVEETVDRFQNPRFQNILDITGRFSASWRSKLEGIDQAVKDAITSIVANRHLIAHGRQSSVSLAHVMGYIQRAKAFRMEYDRICR